MARNGYLENTSSLRDCARRPLALGMLSSLLVASSGTVTAQEVPSFNLYGVPGLVDMPTAEVSPDATLSTTISNFGDNTRLTLDFQITPRLSGSFRYAAISNFDNPASVDGRYYDRSFDLRYQILTEDGYRPSVLIGLQDFLGTGLYGGEYIVATKTLRPGLKLTGGLGWGRLGSHGGFGETGNRPEVLLGEGGVPNYDRWFRGDVAVFGGVSYAVNDQLNLKLEYASDDYRQEEADGRTDRKSQWNFGLDYRLKNGAQLSLYHVYGGEVGAQVTFHTNPRYSKVPGGVESAPVPVAPRPAGAADDLGWTSDNTTVATVRKTLAESLARDKLVFEGLSMDGTTAVLRMRNPTYGATPQAIGRAARIMTRVLPASVENFVIVPVVNGMPASKIHMRRSDLEQLENAAADTMLARTQILDGYKSAPQPEPGLYPRFTWSLSPYVALSVFDPDNPVRANVGARLKASYRITPSLVVSGSLTKKLAGNLNSIEREGTSGLPYVRTDLKEYSRQGDPAIEHLTVAHYGRPGPNLFSRVTAGYLEQMYGGVSGELLWKPIDSRLALGAELNFVKPREFDQLFGFRDYETEGGTIPKLNGHVSAYYNFGNGYHGQIDVGRYLAGDVGATISLDREFANGWRVGAYATFTDADFEDFGEGSFDKGIRFTIPLGAVLGTPSRRSNTTTIQSLTRDGGARLSVNGRLYEQIRDYHREDMETTWGRFWR